MTAATLGAGGAGGLDTSRLTGQDRFDYEPTTIFGAGHDLMAGDERKTHDGLEPPRRTGVHRGQVAPAYTAEARRQPAPTRARQLGRGDLGQTERAEAAAGARSPT